MVVFLLMKFRGITNTIFQFPHRFHDVGIKVAAFGLLFSASLPYSISAQTIPGGADPGRIQKELRNQDFKDRVAPPERPSRKVLPSTTAPKGADKIVFDFNTITVEGVTAYPSGSLEKIANDRIGQKISVQELFNFAAKMTATYRNDGYLLSRVIVPQQEIDDGNVRLRAVEGYIDNILIEGVDRDLEQVIRRYLERLTKERPLSRHTLERYLLLAGDLPGVTVRSFLKPSEKHSAAATLTLAATEKAASYWSRLDNRGSEFVGPYQGEIGASFVGLPGGNKALSVRVITTPLQNKELRYLGLQYQSLFDGEGTGLFVSGNALRSEPGKSLNDLQVKSVSYGLQASINFVPIRQRDENLNFQISLSFLNADTDALGVPFSQDRTRTVGVDGEYQYSGNDGGVTSLSLGGRRGLNSLGGTSDGDVLLSRADAVSDATWFVLRASHLQGLDAIKPGLSVFANLSGQYSIDALSSSREFGVGGNANASAFDSSEISGDHGLSGRLEVRYSTAFSVFDDPDSGKNSRDTGLQIYGFSDGGYVWQEDAEVTGQQNDRIASAGVGARFNINTNLSGSIEAAQPFAQPVSSKGNRDPRVFFQLVGRF